MRSITCLSIVTLFFSFPALAQHKPNTLTAKEIEDGWILLFDGETDYGWKQPDMRWVAADGTIGSSGGNRGMLSSTTAFGDFDLVADVQADRAGFPIWI